MSPMETNEPGGCQKGVSVLQTVSAQLTAIERRLQQAEEDARQTHKDRQRLQIQLWVVAGLLALSLPIGGFAMYKLYETAEERRTTFCGLVESLGNATDQARARTPFIEEVDKGAGTAVDGLGCSADPHDNR